MSRCTGHCCKGFQIGMSPEEVKQHAQDERDNKWPRRMLVDILKVDDMLIPLGFGLPQDFGIEHNDTCEITPAHYFTCRHLKDNGDCGNYADRPDMCRRYPSCGACNYKGCTRIPDKPVQEMNDTEVDEELRSFLETLKPKTEAT